MNITYWSILSPPSIPQFLSIVCLKCTILSELSTFIRLSNFVRIVQFCPNCSILSEWECTILFSIARANGLKISILFFIPHYVYRESTVSIFAPKFEDILKHFILFIFAISESNCFPALASNDFGPVQGSWSRSRIMI